MEGVNSRLRDLALVVGVAILRLDTPSSRLLDWFLSAHEQGLVKQPGLRSIATPGRRKALQTQARRGTGARRADFARVGPESQANRHAQKPPESARLVVEAAGIEPTSHLAAFRRCSLLQPPPVRLPGLISPPYSLI